MKDDLVTLTQRLIKIDSSNPPGKEKEIAWFIRDYLKGLGLRPKIYQFSRGRPNVVCKLTSKYGKKRLLLTPHIDTVPPTGRWRFPPLSAKVWRGKIYGRGATDDKANVAVALYLIKVLKQKGINLDNLDLVFAFTVDEETGSQFGIKPLLKHLKRIDYGVVLDSNEFEVIVAQKGLLHLRVEVFGKEAHGAYPERGVNAIEKSVYILKDIIEEKFTSQTHPLLKRPTINIGRIGGGDKVNIVAGYNFFELDIRYIPSMSEDSIIERIKKIIERHHKRYKVKILAHQRPGEFRKDHFLIRVLRRVLNRYRIKPQYKASFGATVITFLKDRGIEGFCFGFGSRGCAHATNEYVRIRNLHQGVRVLEDYLRKLDGYLGRRNRVA
jgi:succinyl-diaminopimelate desuccinylase